MFALVETIQGKREAIEASGITFDSPKVVHAFPELRFVEEWYYSEDGLEEAYCYMWIEQAEKDALNMRRWVDWEPKPPKDYDDEVCKLLHYFIKELGKGR